MSYEIDELKLQRLVDGALDDAARSAFLKEMDAHPEAWREVALAFVEEQVFTEVIPPQAQLESARTAIPVRRRGGMRILVQAAALAAMLLLAVAAGFQWGHGAGETAAVARQQPSVPGGAEAADAGQPESALAGNDLMERLESMGYRLERDSGFMAGSLPDGSPVLVPVRSVQMAYNGV